METPNTIEELGRAEYLLEDKFIEKYFIETQDKYVKLGFKVSKVILDRQTFDPMKKNTFIAIRYPGTKSKSLIFKQDYLYDHSFKFTEDNFYVYKLGIAFENNFIHFKLFRDIIQKLHEMGITKSQEKKVYNDKQYKTKFDIVEKEIETRILTFDDLRAGFVIWLVAVLASIIVFIFEIVFFKISKKRENAPKIEKSKTKKRKNRKKQKSKAINKMIHQPTQTIDVKTLEIIDLE